MCCRGCEGSRSPACRWAADIVDQITKSATNLLAAALDADGAEGAVTAIREALGIADDDVANYSLPLHWPHDRDRRASNELRYLA